MLSFIVKVLFVALIVAGIFVYVTHQKISLAKLLDSNAISQVKNVNLQALGPQLSGALDALITHPSRNSPVVLGVKITNESLNTVVDVIQKLPPDQFSQLKTAICTPASPSAH